jgi:hypothetical protein
MNAIVSQDDIRKAVVDSLSAPSEDISRDIMLAAGGRPDRIEKAITTGSGLVAYDLQAPAKNPLSGQHAAHQAHPPHCATIATRSILTPGNARKSRSTTGPLIQPTPSDISRSRPKSRRKPPNAAAALLVADGWDIEGGKNGRHDRIKARRRCARDDEVMRVRKDGVRVVSKISDGSVRLSVSEGRDSFVTDMWIGVDLSAEAAAHVAQLLMDAPRHG